MKGQFKIVVPSFNSVNFIPKTLASIESQTNKNYQVCVIDDCSTLEKQREIISEFCQRNQWKSIFHTKNEGALAGIVEAIHSLNCQDDDVIVMLDGDDWLYDEHVLEKLDKIYTEEDVYLTWGQFQTYPPNCIKMNYALPIPEIVIEQQLYREIVDIFGHLKTYKYRLFREIKDEDLRDPQTGEYFRVSWDKALMYPMLEMAGYKVRFVPDLLYVYNIVNPLSDYKINRKEQIIATDYIRSKPHYKRIF
ncbi:glycosyltransferase family 2 protein [Candidatus Protochlamydia phocaeensis]|uniref:glycosyltransferase family 2 protein n=1 Tax=Candidatus Protochlamydia phocaeensis TaxID=1414722 RepID=UPI000837D6E3|nr:glycosyltransferase family 2 protein [Candidatus Protochlamydia phocaeensis]